MYDACFSVYLGWRVLVDRMLPASPSLYAVYSGCFPTFGQHSVDFATTDISVFKMSSLIYSLSVTWRACGSIIKLNVLKYPFAPRLRPFHHPDPEFVNFSCWRKAFFNLVAEECPSHKAGANLTCSTWGKEQLECGPSCFGFHITWLLCACASRYLNSVVSWMTCA